LFCFQNRSHVRDDPCKHGRLSQFPATQIPKLHKAAGQERFAPVSWAKLLSKPEKLRDIQPKLVTIAC